MTRNVLFRSGFRAKITRQKIARLESGLVCAGVHEVDHFHSIICLLRSFASFALFISTLACALRLILDVGFGSPFLSMPESKPLLKDCYLIIAFFSLISLFPSTSI